MKNTAEFTPFGLETWCAALSVFTPQQVNRAVVEIGLSADPFPDLGKVFSRCERLRREQAGTLPSNDNQRPSPAIIKSAAEAMGLEL